MESKTLEQIIAERKTIARREGKSDIDACKESIKQKLAMRNWFFGNTDTYYTLLEEFVKKANEDELFNRNMVLACWEIINEK